MTTALEEPVLVLNKSWRIVAVASVRRALEQIYGEKAKIVDPVTYADYTFDQWMEKGVVEGAMFVRTKNFDFQVPEVIVLQDYNSFPKHGETYSKHHVFKRDKYHCQYCGQSVRREDATIDHVIPKSRGGQTNWENCVCSCLTCNSEKADRTPKEAGMKLRSVPGRPSWKPEDVALRYSERSKKWANFLGKSA